MRETTAYEVSSWSELLQIYRDRPALKWDGWVFRGQTRGCWDLKSSLERAAAQFDIPLSEASELEHKLVREFQRRAHEFCPDAPDIWDKLGWLALMQHWSAPTRLLDWTYSFYVAAFFAAADAGPDQPCTLWALNARWCTDTLRKRFADHQGPSKPRPTEELLFGDLHSPGLYPVNPYLLHERLGAQQGLFVAPGDVAQTFLENYEAMNPPTEEPPLLRINLTCGQPELDEIYQDLRRMNITYSTLFPGLDGYGKHIGKMIRIVHLTRIDEPTIP